MIVKVITRGTGYDSDEAYKFQNIYECSHLSINEWEGHPMSLNIEGLKYAFGCILVSLDAPKTEVYIMNDDGKTIDRFETSYTKPNVECSQ